MSCPKYQYYQSDSILTIEVFEPNMNENTVQVNFEADKLLVIVERMTGTSGSSKRVTVMCGTLYDRINPSKSKLKFKDEKFLIKLSKENKGYEWGKLFGLGVGREASKNDSKTTSSGGDSATATTTPVATEAATVETTTVPMVDTARVQNRPYASHRDWDAIGRNIEKQEEDERKEGGEGAFQNFLQTIYKDADEDARRAMIKSYQTSGGTVLNCNWDEVSKKDYEKDDRVAPKGQQWKTWEGKTLPTKDDD